MNTKLAATLLGLRSSEVYCGHCHLATPSRKEKCIHCFKPLAPLAGSGKSAATLESESIGVAVTPSKSQVSRPFTAGGP